MSLYLSPPTGDIPFHKIEEVALKRLQFLLRLVACQDNEEVDHVLQDASVVNQSDCLIVNTAKDAISHYMLRLVLGGDLETSYFFLESETTLFWIRMERMVEEEWIQFFRFLDKEIGRINVHSSCIQCPPISDLICLVEHLKEKFDSCEQLCAELCKGENSASSVCLPFKLVLKLIAKRQVDISKGFATVPMPQLKDVLLELFENLMAVAVKQAVTKREKAMADERIQRLAVILKRAHKREAKPALSLPDNFSPLRLSDLWSGQLLFPPCMDNLLSTLKTQHRLKHTDRIQLTLFLKELGLPVHDALLLWKHWYSIPTSTVSASCHHGWNGNEKRYTYNIRHLYGLEGSRINYRAHGCSSIQGRSLSCGDAGDCLFTSPDYTTLTALLSKNGIDTGCIAYLLEKCKNHEYSCACQGYMYHKSWHARKEQQSYSSESHIQANSSLESQPEAAKREAIVNMSYSNRYFQDSHCSSSDAFHSTDKSMQPRKLTASKMIECPERLTDNPSKLEQACKRHIHDFPPFSVAFQNGDKSKEVSVKPLTATSFRSLAFHDDHYAGCYCQSILTNTTVMSLHPKSDLNLSCSEEECCKLCSSNHHKVHKKPSAAVLDLRMKNGLAFKSRIGKDFVGEAACQNNENGPYCFVCKRTKPDSISDRIGNKAKNDGTEKKYDSVQGGEKPDDGCDIMEHKTDDDSDNCDNNVDQFENGSDCLELYSKGKVNEEDNTVCSDNSEDLFEDISEDSLTLNLSLTQSI